MDLHRMNLFEVQRLIDNSKVVLGKGGFGKVLLVNWRGENAVLKISLDQKNLLMFDNEVKMMMSANGAGGVPKVLAISDYPLAFLTTFKGVVTLEHIIKAQTKFYKPLDLILQVAEKLQELHKTGLIHNDLKANNVVVSGCLDMAKVSIIDLGLACRDGQCLHMNNSSTLLPWMAPEVLSGRPSTTASDVYSFGVLLQEVLLSLPASLRYRPLNQLSNMATSRDQRDRPRMSYVIYRLRVALGKAVMLQPLKRRRKTILKFPCRF